MGKLEIPEGLFVKCEKGCKAILCAKDVIANGNKCTKCGCKIDVKSSEVDS